ncbi:MAG: TldD/PmbA family protein [Bacillota bacterium]
MQDPRQTAGYALDALLKAGADKAQCLLVQSDKHEMNVDSGELSLLRTTFDTRLALTALQAHRKGSSSGNKSDPESVDRAVAECVSIAQASQPDEANDIAGAQPREVFTTGADAPDLDRMHFRLQELLEAIRTRYPKALLRQAFLDFTRTKSYFVNSNGVDFETHKGVYHCFLMFSSRENGKVSSFNYTGFATRDLDRELISCGSLDTLLRQSGEQTTTRPMQGKFVGDLIITPDCLGDTLGFLVRSISDFAMISGTSIYKDSLGQEVASPRLTLHSRPVSDEICDGYFVTADGHAAASSTIVEEGVLKSFLLSLYGSRKTGKARAVNDGSAWVVDPGSTSLEDMVKSVKRGVLMARFSGGSPSINGDFSGVAKNSYLIEDGRIAYPLSETMVSGNFAEMLKSITAISSERVDYGEAILPWVAVSGVTISGK